jgi:GNAT superfamily N-acetyltransferase
VEQVVVRSATSGDVKRLVELLAHGALDDRREDPNDLSAYLAALTEIQASPGSDVLVAELGGEVVGMCQLVVFRHLQHRGGLCAEVESMHVHPKFRGRGIGKQLLDAAVDIARREGCYRVQLTSNRQRTDAHRFYERHGFAASHVGFKRLIDRF